MTRLRRPLLSLLLLSLLLIAADRPYIYRVRPGDTLSEIAARFGLTLEALLAANPMPDPALLHAGQQLRIPGLIRAGPLRPAGTTGSRLGLAMAVPDLADLRPLGLAHSPGWYYNWDLCRAPGCVPLARAMETPPACPPVLLAGNEPNALEPFGAPLAPGEAVARVLALRRACPATRLAVGGVSADDWRPAGGWGSGAGWLRAFLREYRAQAGRPFDQALAVHCYTQQDAGYCIEKLKEMRRLYTGPMWLTEFGVLSGDPVQFAAVLRSACGKFQWVAAYTNRQPHSGQGWELAQGVELIDEAGQLKPAGEVYARGC
ncbi:MAG: LysM peptidoglycan-binding domain-containing protein [Chloroflexi bacterium]|nr:LysM peptidoglycan-binding domain-containing protein [Chloroflexota bacterium]